MTALAGLRELGRVERLLRLLEPRIVDILQHVVVIGGDQRGDGALPCSSGLAGTAAGHRPARHAPCGRNDTVCDTWCFSKHCNSDTIVTNRAGRIERHSYFAVRYRPNVSLLHTRGAAAQRKRSTQSLGCWNPRPVLNHRGGGNARKLSTASLALLRVLLPRTCSQPKRHE